MSGIRIHLLGPPSIDHAEHEGQQPRGRKSWGLLAYLLLHRTPTPRSLLAAMLFPEAGDPLGALRWHLSDLRRALGPGTDLQGDPVVLHLPPDSRYDADTSRRTTASAEAISTGDLLDRLDFSDCPGFDTWLTVERHRIRHFVETSLYENGLDALAAGNLHEAVELAGQAVGLDSLNADFHALLVRGLLASGDRTEARGQAAKCARLFAAHFGSGMPAEVQQALAAPDTRTSALPATVHVVRSYLEAAAACLSAGATVSALAHLRVAGGLAERTGSRQLQAEAMLALAGALIHGAGGRGTEVADLLHRVVVLSRDGKPEVQSAAYRELGFLAVQRGFPASGFRWLEQAEAAATSLPGERAKVLGVRGMLATDTADYPSARQALSESASMSLECGVLRQEAFARAMLGRVHLLTGALIPAAGELDASLDIVDREHWAAFRPLVEALRSEVLLLSGFTVEAEDMANHAAALAEAFGDRCYMDAAVHAKTLILLAAGDLASAQSWISRGLRPDPWYRWFRSRNLDLACRTTLKLDPSLALAYARELSDLSSRYGHDELTVRAYSFRAVLGDAAATTAIPLLAARIQNPLLAVDLANSSQP